MLKVEKTKWICEETEGTRVCTTCLKKYNNIFWPIVDLYRTGISITKQQYYGQWSINRKV